jgi:hypothetical protein
LTGGCGTVDAQGTITVNALPTITGTTNVNTSGTTQLTGSGTPAASTPWTSSNTGIATVSSTGLVTGIATGIAIITYTNNLGCQATTSVFVSLVQTANDGAWSLNSNWDGIPRGTGDVSGTLLKDRPVFVKNRITYNVPSNSSTITVGSITSSQYYLHIQSGSMTVGATATGVASPTFTGSVVSALTDETEVTLSTSASPALISGSLIQLTGDSGGGPLFANGSRHYNRILGTVNSFSGSTVDLFSNANFETSSGGYSGSILLDPQDLTDHYELILDNPSTYSATQAALDIKGGIVNFEGGLIMNKGNVTVRSGATLVLGPLVCRVCDPYDPQFNASTCNTYSTTTNYCNQKRVRTLGVNNLTVEAGGRIIVYGDVEILNTGSTFNVAGGIFVIGDLTTTNSITLTGNGGIYTTGTMVSSLTAAQIGSLGTNNCDDAGPCAAGVSGVILPYRQYDTQGGSNATLSSLFSLSVQRAGNFNFCSNTNLFTVTLKDSGTTPGLEENAGSTVTLALFRYNSTTATWDTYNANLATMVYPSSAAVPTSTTIQLPAFGTAGLYSSGSELFAISASTSKKPTQPLASPIIKVVVPSFNRWTGATSTNWDTNSNWCLGVPTATQDLKINTVPSARNPIIAASTIANAKDIRIESSVTLTNNSETNINPAQTGSLNIYGDLLFLGNSKLLSLPVSNTNFKTGNGNNRTIIDSNSNLPGDIIFGNVTVDASTNLVLPSKELGHITIEGDLTLNGTLNLPSNGSTLNAVSATRSKIIFSGSSSQSIAATGNNAFYDIDVNKTGGGITLTSGPLNLYGKLSFASGTILTSNGNLRIKSITASSTPNGNSGTNLLNGSIGQLPSGASIAGNVVAERFVPSGPTAYRYLTIPVSSSTTIPSQFSTRYTYSTSNGRYVLGGALTGGIGYAVLYKWWATNAALTFTGPLRTGIVKLMCSAADCIENTSVGWHLVGNPYAHPIYFEDFSVNGGFGACGDANCTSLATIPSGIQRIIAIRDNTSGRLRYALASGIPDTEDFWFGKKSANSCDGDTGSNCNGLYKFNGVIDIGQAFWVYVKSSAGSSLILDESAKVLPGGSNKDPNFFNRVTPDSESTDELNLAIQIKNEAYSDFAFHSFGRPRRSNLPMDPAMTLPKLWSQELNVYFLDAENRPKLNTVSGELGENEIIPLGIKADVSGELSIDFEFSDNFKYAGQIYLIDTYEGKSHLVVKGDPYTFQNGDVGTEVNNRFYLSKNPVIVSRETRVNVYPNPAKDKVTIKTFGLPGTSSLRLMDMSGNVLYQTDFENETTMDVTTYPAGIFFIQVANERGKFTEKMVKIN